MMLLPEAATEKLPDVLLPYQQELLTTTSRYAVVICEKSRRIGMTWAVAADAVLTSATKKDAGGMDTLYIGYSLDMAKEFIDTAASWAKAFNRVCGEVEETLFKDEDEREIQAFRIKFDSGFEIMALTSRPRSLRGRQGYVIIDEAAFCDDLEELMKAALALLIWGGKVLVISTHNGVDNHFNQMILDARSGRNKYEILTVDFDEALKDGLYRRICLVTGKTWTEEGEREWRQNIVDFYGTGAEEELFCIPRRSAGTFLPGTLIESRMVPTHVIRYELPHEFVYRPEFERERVVSDWCHEKLKPYLEMLDPNLLSYFGEDFGRSGDLTILWPLQVRKDLVRHTPFTVELRNIPFTQQRQIVWYIIDRLPRFSVGAFDARGNGQQMAEESMQRYGVGRIHQIMITPMFYASALPRYKRALEDAQMELPRDADILADHRLAVVEAGRPSIPDKRTTGSTDGKQRHGDSLVAAALAFWSSEQEGGLYEYMAVGGVATKTTQSGLVANDDDDDSPRGARGFKQGAY